MLLCYFVPQYWECISGQAVLKLCGPGTLFDEDLKICNWENQVDTSSCTLWICEVDNTYFPHADCDKVSYYMMTGFTKWTWCVSH